MTLTESLKILKKNGYIIESFGSKFSMEEYVSRVKSYLTVLDETISVTELLDIIVNNVGDMLLGYENSVDAEEMAKNILANEGKTSNIPTVKEAMSSLWSRIYSRAENDGYDSDSAANIASMVEDEKMSYEDACAIEDDNIEMNSQNAEAMWDF